MLQGLVCPCCAGPITRVNAPCDHCGTLVRESASHNGIEPARMTLCPNCNCECFEGQNVCLKCRSLIRPSPKLRKSIEKIRFSQDKYRASFTDEVRQRFSPNEFVLADTYGLREYYIVTTHRLLICQIKMKTGFFSSKQLRGGVKSAISFDRVTRMTTWSDLWYPNNDPVYDPALMDLQIETFDGDINISVVFDSQQGYFHKDPYFFQTCLCEAFHHHEEELSFYDHVLYQIATQPQNNHVSRAVDGPQTKPSSHAVTPPDEKFVLRCTCNAQLYAKRSDAGKTGNCPNCHRKFKILSL